MIPVTLFYEGTNILDLILPAVPSVGDRLVVMDMDFSSSYSHTCVDWTITAVVWAVYPKLSDYADTNIRVVELQVEPYVEPSVSGG